MAAFVGAVAQGLGSNQGPILLSTSKNLHFGDMPKEPFAAWDAVRRSRLPPPPPPPPQILLLVDSRPRPHANKRRQIVKCR